MPENLSPDSLDAMKELSVSQVLTTGVQKLGKTLITNLGIALKVSRLYSCQHQNVTDALNDLVDVVNNLIESEGYLQITRFEEFLLVNDVRVRLDFGGAEGYRYIVDTFTERGIGEVAFSSGIERDEFERFIDLVNRNPGDGTENPWEDFHPRVRACNLPHLSVGPERERKESDEEVIDDTRVIAFQTFFKCCYGTKSALESARTGTKANLKRLKRNVQTMVDSVLNDPNPLLALVNLKSFASPASNHATNTAVLSIALGCKLGLSKKLLGDLGMAALLHDMGKARSKGELPPRDAFTAEQEEEFRRHVYHGPDALLRQRVVNATVKSVNVAFLHHYRFDGTGYPKLVQPKEQNLFTRIVAVANFYDNCTAPGRMSADAMGPEEVMRRLLEASGTEFDPLVVKAFVNLMGLYPVGCMVQLCTGEVGTVTEPSRDPRYLDRPRVKLVIDAYGGPTDRQLDLMDRDGGGGFSHSILKLYQQEEISLDVEEYLSVI